MTTLRACAAGLALLGALVYAPSVRAPFVYDDRAAVVGNQSIRRLWPLSVPLSPPAHTPVSGRPTVNLSLAVDYAIGGLDPFSYHVTNVAIHLACALLLFAIVRRTLERVDDAADEPTRSAHAVVATVAAALWMVHPLASEPVLYVSARTESVMALCLLTTVYASIRGERHVGWVVAAIAACAAGMAAKESMVAAPLLVILYDRIYRTERWRELVRSRWPLYAGLCATWIVLAVMLAANPRGESAGFSGDAGLGPVVSSWVYVLNQSKMVWRYLRMAVWPAGLVLDYGFPRPLTFADVWLPATLLAAVIATGVAVAIARPRIGFLIVWFLATLAPASSFVPVHTEVGAERRMYLPLMAIVVGAVVAAARMLPAHRTRRLSPIFAAVMLLATAALATATVRRTSEYESERRIWETVVDRWPHGRARFNLAMQLKAAGERDAALAMLRQSAEDYPDARSVLGFELLDRGMRDEGIAELRTFIRERPSHVNVVLAHGRIGDALFAAQRYEEAIAEYRAYLAHRSGPATVWTNLGIALAATERTADAVPAFERAAALEPASANAHRNLANALLEAGDRRRAFDEATAALRLAPNDAVAREITTLAAPGKELLPALGQPPATQLRFASPPVANDPQPHSPSAQAKPAPPPPPRAPSPAQSPSGSAPSSSHAAQSLADFASRPVPLRSGIGSAHDMVHTASADAQKFYDQGLAYLHSYVWLEAARSFNQVLRLDRSIALAHVGLTVAYTELNAPAQAAAALSRARLLATTAHDRRHVELRALQADAEAAPRDVGKLAAYRAAVDRAVAEFPDDEELWLLRGQAETPDPAERGQGSTAGSVRFYQKAAALAPGHFAGHHFLAHAYENSGMAAEALTEASIYAKMAPDVPHARHMHGHSLRRSGQIDAAIGEFSAADRLESAYLAAERIPAEYDWHYQHNLDLLATSYQYAGRMKAAEETFKRSFAISSSLLVQEFNKREWPMFLVARGRAREALDAARTMIANRSPVVSAAGHVAAGHAQLALGAFQAATDEANAALRAIRGAEGGGLVAVPLQALQGEFFLRTGQRDKGRAMLQEVAKKARARPGPDAWAETLFTLEAIARTARDVGDWDFAAWAAAQMREHDPNYAGTHYAHAVVAEHEGDAKTAAAERALAEKAWKNADSDVLVAVRRQ